MKTSPRKSLPAVVLAVAALLCAGGTLSGLAKTTAARLQERAQVLSPDRGRFRILVDGQPLGSETFEILWQGSQWLSRGQTEIRTPEGKSARVRAELKLNADGAPLAYDWSAQGEKESSAAITFEGGTARMSLHLKGAQPFTQEFQFNSPRVVILDNNMFHHYAILAGLYDWKAKGSQSFAVLIPQDLTPGSITVDSAGAVQSPRGTLEMLRVRSSDLEVEVYLDESRRLVRLAVPASKAEVVRE